jgi:hypothetical protein
MYTTFLPYKHPPTYESVDCVLLRWIWSDRWSVTMRYDDWDVILFPKDSPVPIQEFKTACYHAQDSSKFPHSPLLKAKY